MAWDEGRFPDTGHRSRTEVLGAMTNIQVGYFVGSLSSTSINRVLSRALIRVAPDDMDFTEIPIGNLPLYTGPRRCSVLV